MSQPSFDFGLPDTMRARSEPWMAADARRDAHARQTREKKQKLYEEILEFAHGRGGFTADELAESWDCSPNHVAPRISELLKLGKLVETGARRKTRSGAWAAVLNIFLDNGSSAEAPK